MLSALLTLFVFGLVGLVLIGVVLAVVGAVLGVAFGIASFLLFKVAPVLLIGYLVLRLVNRGRSRRRISAADQRWLDS